MKPLDQLAHRFPRKSRRAIHQHRLNNSLRLALFGLDALGFSLFRNLLRAARIRAAFAVPRARAAGHMTPLAVHRRHYSRIGEGQRQHPHRG